MPFTCIPVARCQGKLGDKQQQLEGGDWKEDEE